MRTLLLAAGLAAATISPTAAFAQTKCETHSGKRIVGTVAGGGAGALLGSAIAGRGDKTLGAVIGAVGGALLGNQVTKSSATCANAYGHYDREGRWHATDVEQQSAAGYFDREGQWVAGPPNGRYDSSGRWISGGSNVDAGLYRDRQGQWVPASANGYYDTQGRWIAGAASGYYDRAGRWVAGSATGAYDARGRWIAGASNAAYGNQGNGTAGQQRGYYNSNGRWVAGPAVGYYDAAGRWISTGSIRDDAAYQNNGDQNRGYQNGNYRDGERRRDLSQRSERLHERIRTAYEDGSLTRAESRRGYSELQQIRRQEMTLRRGNRELSEQNERDLHARLDRLSDRLRMARSDNQFGERTGG